MAKKEFIALMGKKRYENMNHIDDLKFLYAPADFEQRWATDQWPPVRVRVTVEVAE
jgi:hypothetical protein